MPPDTIRVWNPDTRKTSDFPICGLQGARVVAIKGDGVEGIATLTLKLRGGAKIVLAPGGDSNSISAQWEAD